MMNERPLCFPVVIAAGLLMLFRPPYVVAEPVVRLPIVDRAIAHHGGSLFAASRVTYDVCSKSGCSSVSVEMNGGSFEYDVTAAVGATERRVRSRNSSVELWESGEVVPVPTSERGQQLRDWAMQRVYFNFLPFRLNDPSVFKEDLGTEVWQGRPLRKVKVTFEPDSSTDASDEYLYWFDPETARLEQFAYSYDVNGGGLRFRKLFNYRRVNEMLFYDQQNWGTEGSDLSVGLVTEEYVEAEMRHITTVELRELRVERLP